nr:MAG TPA: hypothetical protein [Caudoviricetes sp.]
MSASSRILSRLRLPLGSHRTHQNSFTHVYLDRSE